MAKGKLTATQQAHLEKFEQLMILHREETTKFMNYCLQYRQYCEWQLHKIVVDYTKVAADFQSCIDGSNSTMSYVRTLFENTCGELELISEEVDAEKETIQ